MLTNTPSYLSNIAVGLVAIVLAYFGYCFNGAVKQPLIFMGLWLGLLLTYVFTIKKFPAFAKGLFAVVAMMVSFLIFCTLGTEMISAIMPACTMASDGQYHCAMPIAQILFGMVFAVIATPLTWRFYRNHRQTTWEIAWQISVLVGMIVRFALDWLSYQTV